MSITEVENRHGPPGETRSRAVTFTADLRELNVFGWAVDTIGDYAGHAHLTKPRQLLAMMVILLFTLTGARKDLTLSGTQRHKFSLNTYQLLYNDRHWGYTSRYAECDQLAYAFAREVEAHAVKENSEESWITEHRGVMIGGKSMRALTQDYMNMPHYRPPSESLNRSTKLTISKMTEGRRLAGTKRGVPVLVPVSAMDGDLICVLRQCPVPVVLRRVESHYVLIGECVHYGHMNGYREEDIDDAGDTDESETEAGEIVDGDERDHLEYRSSMEPEIKPRPRTLRLETTCWERLIGQPEVLFNIR